MREATAAPLKQANTQNGTRTCLPSLPLSRPHTMERVRVTKLDVRFGRLREAVNNCYGESLLWTSVWDQVCC